MKKNKLILVTGASGFIGSFLVEELIKQGHQVHCLIRRQLAKRFGKKESEIAFGDLADYNSLNQATKDVNLVIHLAAIINSKKKKLYQKVNVFGTANLIKACQKNGVGKIIFLSSVYANKQEGEYGQSKFLGEELIKKSGLNYTIIRPNLVFGPKGEGALFKIVKMIKNWPLVIIPGDGRYKRQPVFVKDLVRLIIRCLNNNISDNKIYQLGGPEILTFNQLVDILSQRLNVRRPKIHLPKILLKIFFPFVDLKSMLADKISDNLAIKKDFDFDLNSLKDSIF